MSSEVLKVSVIRKSQPIDIEIEEGKDMRLYVKEMTGAQRDDYFNRAAKKTKTNAQGDVIGFSDYSGSLSLLLSYCLYDADGKLIPEKTIQEWPDAAQKALNSIASALNGFGKEGDEKN